MELQRDQLQSDYFSKLEGDAALRYGSKVKLIGVDPYTIIGKN